MRAIFWFLVGAKEFRYSVTSNPSDHALSYDWGREWAHRLTFRRFELC